MIPLLEFAKSYLDLDHSRFYTPGHKGGQGLAEAWQEVLLDFRALGRLDFPELSGFIEALAEAETLSAHAHHCDRSYFLVNGATEGVQAALMAVAGDGDLVLVGRNCHRSTLGGLILTGAMPVYLPCGWEQGWQIDLGVSVETVADYLQQFPMVKAVILVSPNYFGVVSEISAIANLCHDRQIPLIIDSAHGSHLGYHPDLPPSPIDCGADLVIQSHHKTLTAFSQGAVLHCQGNLVDRVRLEQAIRTLQSTSPNLLILLSLDIARQQMQDDAGAALERLNKLVQELQARSPLPWFLPPAPYDWTKITINSGKITGFEADALLTKHLGVICELPTLRHLVFSLSFASSHEDLQKLEQAFQYLGDNWHQEDLFPSCGLEVWVDTPELLVSPRQAFFSAKELVPIDQAPDRISAETLCPYPPGIPVIGIGERINPTAISYLQTMRHLGAVINGASDPQLAYLTVLK